eukprot:c19383_g1_i1.p1 GENE.c19383_g1_i1~~c19383_g1_i1.p1  ORF type:complete len:309 (+),score=44.58 c19383_g1_i1:40-966(+)
MSFLRCWSKPSQVESLRLGYRVPEWCTDPRDCEALAWFRQTDAYDLVSDEKILEFFHLKQYSTHKTAALLRIHVEWIRKYQPANITFDMIRVPLRTGCWRVMGHDKLGRPIVWLQIQYWNVHEYSADEVCLPIPANRGSKSLHNSFCFESARLTLLWLQYISFLTWFVKQLLELRRDGATQIVGVFDYSGWKSTHLLYVAHIRAVLDTAQYHFPGLVGMVYVVRANWVFHKAWKVIKPWCDEETQRTVVFVLDSAITTTLLEVMDRSVLPTIYGGDAATPPCPNIPGIDNIIIEGLVSSVTQELEGEF